MSNGSEVNSLGLVAARVGWMFIGPVMLALLLFAIVGKGNGWLTGTDVAYFVVLAAIIICRWFEQRSGRATTAYGELATWKDFKAYAYLVISLATACWLIANALGNHVFGGFLSS